MQAQITVAASYPPKPGQKTGQIVDTTGKRWGFFPDKISPPANGANIVIEYVDREYQGRVYSRVERIVSGAPAAPASAPYRPTTPAPVGSLAHRDETAERIFVCGVLNNAIQSGKVDPVSPSEMIACVQAARAAYAQTFGN